MHHYFKKGKNATEMQKIGLCGVQRRCRDLLNMSKCFVKFCAGDFSLDDAPQSGRPVETDKRSNHDPRGEDSQPTHNIQPNKVIGENEKCVFYFTGNNYKQTFSPTQ